MPTHFTRGKYREEDRVIAPSLAAIENAYDVLRAIPEQDSASWFRLQDSQQAADSGDAQQVCWHLFWDAYNWLKFFWYTSAYKAQQLTAGLIHSYNTDNLLSWVILGRSALEYAAISYYFVRRMSQLQLEGPDFAGSQLKGLEDMMLQYTHGTRFNWRDLLAGNVEKLLNREFDPTGSSKAVNVLTAISHLAQRDARYKDVEIAYAMLSDFAHPNMASHTTVVEMTAQHADKHQSRMAVQPGSLRGEFMMVVTLPWVSTGVGTTVELLAEVSPLLETWLDYVQQGARITIDFKR